MILAIPSIKISNGSCLNHIVGEFGTEDLYDSYSKQPHKLIKLLRKENAKSVYALDVDSYITGMLDYQCVQYMCNSTDIPLQLRANFSQYTDLERIFEMGVYRAVCEMDFLAKLSELSIVIETFTASRVAFYCDWDKVNNFRELYEQLTLLKKYSFNRVYLKFGESNNDEKMLKTLAFFAQFQFRVTADIEISKPEELWNLSNYIKNGLDSVLIGNSIFNNNFPCQKIWRLIEAELENDF